MECVASKLTFREIRVIRLPAGRRQAFPQLMEVRLVYILSLNFKSCS